MLFRHCREKFERKPEHEQERETTGDALHKKSAEHFEDEIDMILDCKMFQRQPHRKVESVCIAQGRLAILVRLRLLKSLRPSEQHRKFLVSKAVDFS